MKRDGGGRERDTHTKEGENMICFTAMPTDKILVSCKRGLRATPNMVMVGAALKRLSFVARQSSMQARSHVACTENTLAYSHAHTASVKKQAY